MDPFHKTWESSRKGQPIVGIGSTEKPYESLRNKGKAAAYKNDLRRWRQKNKRRRE